MYGISIGSDHYSIHLTKKRVRTKLVKTGSLFIQETESLSSQTHLGPGPNYSLGGESLRYRHQKINFVFEAHWTATKGALKPPGLLL